MPWPKGKPRPPQSGRQRGTKNKRTQAIEAYAKRLVEDPAVQAALLQQARQGTLPAPVLQMLFYYAYGKPVERIEQSGPGGGPLQYEDLTPAERRARIAELATRALGQDRRWP